MQYQALCDALASLIPGRIEAVLHDLRTGRIAYIAGAFSNRMAGDPSLLSEELPHASDIADGAVGPYVKRNWDGQRLRSVSAVVGRDGDTPTLMICINMLTGDLEGAAELLAQLTGSASDPRARPLVEGDWREAAHDIIGTVLSARQVTLAAARKADKAAILAELDKAGILQIRGAPDYVAKAMAISRAALYATLKDIRETEGQDIR
ncbi:PAS domain-containing protein [Pelagivirga sediminicola]|nr:PAS domain-containing protein [Pelagivirga sediminicola]